MTNLCYNMNTKTDFYRMEIIAFDRLSEAVSKTFINLKDFTMELTQKKLKSILNYDKNTGIFTRIKNTSSRARIGDIVGCMNKDGYLVVHMLGKLHYLHRLAMLYVNGEFPKDEVDHINHNRSDNRFCNLRSVGRVDNGRNISIGTRNKSGAVGVHFLKKLGKWESIITVNKERVFLGRFDNKKDAISARKKGEMLYGFHENHGKDKLCL